MFEASFEQKKTTEDPKIESVCSRIEQCVPLLIEAAQELGVKSYVMTYSASEDTGVFGQSLVTPRECESETSELNAAMWAFLELLHELHLRHGAPKGAKEDGGGGLLSMDTQAKTLELRHFYGADQPELAWTVRMSA